jgi:hypothetical protein
VLDESNAGDKKKIAAKNCNAVAMANLSMAFTSDGLKELIFKAVTVEWPNGRAHLVIKGLFRKCQPQDTVMRVELWMMLNKIGMMKKKTNPARMFEQIASVKNWYSTMATRIPQDELIAIVLDKATMEYQAVLMAEQRAQGNALTLDTSNRS